MLCVVLFVFVCFYVYVLLYAPIHQNKFQVGVNLLGNKYYSDSDSDSGLRCVPQELRADQQSQWAGRQPQNKGPGLHGLDGLWPTECGGVRVLLIRPTGLQPPPSSSTTCTGAEIPHIYCLENHCLKTIFTIHSMSICLYSEYDAI